MKCTLARLLMVKKCKTVKFTKKISQLLTKICSTKTEDVSDQLQLAFGGSANNEPQT